MTSSPSRKIALSAFLCVFGAFALLDMMTYLSNGVAAAITLTLLAAAIVVMVYAAVDWREQ